MDFISLRVETIRGMEAGNNMALLLQIVGWVLLHQLVIVKGNLNIAFNKQARQSSTFGARVNNPVGANLALDGNKNNSFGGRSCAHTESDDLRSPWWEVDLQNPCRIARIKILNRDIFAERLHDVKIDVYVHKKKPRKKKQCTKHPGVAGPGWLSLSCEPVVIGRYVRITKPKEHVHDELTLCEVEIYEPRDEFRFLHLQRMSMCKVLGEPQKLMSRSLLHCGSTCGFTPGCTGFYVAKQEDGSTGCNVVMRCPDKSEKVGRRDCTTFYHHCW